MSSPWQINGSASSRSHLPPPSSKLATSPSAILPCRPGEYPPDHPNPTTDLPDVTISSAGGIPTSLADSSQRERTVILGTRRSNLAHVQTSLVRSALLRLHPDLDFVISSHSTVGDKNQTTPLHLLSPYSSTQPAKSLWTDELEAKLLAGDLDLIVHSCKDVPTVLKEEFEIACLLEREDPRDGVAIKAGSGFTSLEELPEGSVVGTGSVRRVAQLKRAFPGLVFEDMRGNLNTRLGKLDSPSSPFLALILAYSGMHRINQSHRITSLLSSPVLYHAVGQGALAVEVRRGDAKTREVLRGLGHWQTEWRVGAERGCLRVLEGGCSVPVGVETELIELSSAECESSTTVNNSWSSDLPPLTAFSPTLHFSGLLSLSQLYPSLESTGEVTGLIPRHARLTLKTCVTSLDGSEQVVYAPEAVIVRSYAEAERWGEHCARVIKEQGGGKILDEINEIRRQREEAEFQEALKRSRAQEESAVPAAAA